MPEKITLDRSGANTAAIESHNAGTKAEVSRALGGLDRLLPRTGRACDPWAGHDKTPPTMRSKPGPA
jgi:hypothetical protein